MASGTLKEFEPVRLRYTVGYVKKICVVDLCHTILLRVHVGLHVHVLTLCMYNVQQYMHTEMYILNVYTCTCTYKLML